MAPGEPASPVRYETVVRGRFLPEDVLRLATPGAVVRGGRIPALAVRGSAGRRAPHRGGHGAGRVTPPGGGATATLRTFPRRGLARRPAPDGRDAPIRQPSEWPAAACSRAL